MKINKTKLKEFLQFIKEKTPVNSLELIEKDFYLNVLLSELNLQEYALKGGTCLAKIYLDYFRFSEDLDFTYINQELFRNKSTKKIKKICKEKINEFGKQLETTGFDFIFDKSDRKYVEIGNNNKLATFKMWYKSGITGMSSFIKIQINYLELMNFKIKTKETIPLLKEELSKNEKIYFQEYTEYYAGKSLNVYDIREIVSEKIRSLLTRKAIKSRDSIDLLFIYQKYKIRPEDFLKEAKEKIIFAIRNYDKYRENLILAEEKLAKVNFSYEEVRHMIIRDFKRKSFENFVIELRLLLQQILKEINQKNETKT